ncbi:MAG TPA: hypothetical protein VLC09_21300 [Polyangiaceae bacterium]|nr:hypothetical protein [Polyangiaceae bacterium]
MTASALVLSAAPAAAAERDITSVASRDTAASGYTLPAKTWGFDAGLLGVNSGDAFASLGIRVGLGGGLELGTNVAHAGVGLINLNLGWMFVDSRVLSIAARFEPSYLHGDWMWIVSAQELVSGLDAWILPVSVTASSFATDWLQFDLRARFVDSEVVGSANGESLVFRGQLALRQVSIDPGVRFHVLRRASFYLRARLPLWSSIPGSASAEVILDDGVIAGGSTSGEKQVPFEQAVLCSAGARAMVGEASFLDFSFNFGHATEALYGSVVQPRISWETRF